MLFAVPQLPQAMGAWKRFFQGQRTQTTGSASAQVSKAMEAASVQALQQHVRAELMTWIKRWRLPGEGICCCDSIHACFGPHPSPHAAMIIGRQCHIVDQLQPNRCRQCIHRFNITNTRNGVAFA